MKISDYYFRMSQRYHRTHPAQGIFVQGLDEINEYLREHEEEAVYMIEYLGYENQFAVYFRCGHTAKEIFDCVGKMAQTVSDILRIKSYCVRSLAKGPHDEMGLWCEFEFVFSKKKQEEII